MLPQSLITLKRQVICHIRQMIKPHVWRSGYLNDDGSALKIFCFANVNGSNTRNMGSVFDGELTVLQGFYENGTIDTCGGGCGCRSGWWPQNKAAKSPTERFRQSNA